MNPSIHKAGLEGVNAVTLLIDAWVGHLADLDLAKLHTLTDALRLGARFEVAMRVRGNAAEIVIAIVDDYETRQTADSFRIDLATPYSAGLPAALCNAIATALHNLTAFAEVVGLHLASEMPDALDALRRDAQPGERLEVAVRIANTDPEIDISMLGEHEQRRGVYCVRVPASVPTMH